MFPSGDRPELNRQEAHLLLDEVLDGAASGADLPGAAASVALRAWRQLNDVVDGAAVRMIPRWDSSGDWIDDGAASASQWFTAQTGTSKAAAGSFRKVAHALEKLPHVGPATWAGRLSLAHARELVGARAPDVEAEFERDEAELVAAAATMTYEELRAYLLNWRYGVLEAAARNEDERPPGPESDADRINLFDGFAGRGILAGDLTPETTALIRSGIDAEIETMMRDGAFTGAWPSGPELQGLAVANIFRRNLATDLAHGAPRPSIVAVADLDTLLRRSGGSAADRMVRRAEILGAGPVTDETIAKLCCDVTISLAITDGHGQPRWLGRARRTATAAQHRALIARSGGHCEMPGCGAAPSRCQAHHLQYWEHDGPTDITNLALICHRHHQLIHDRTGWRLVLDHGRLRVFRPDGTEIRTRRDQLPPPHAHAA